MQIQNKSIFRNHAGIHAVFEQQLFWECILLEDSSNIFYAN